MECRENEGSGETLRQTDASTSEFEIKISHDSEFEKFLFLLSTHANVMNDESFAPIAFHIAYNHNARQVSTHSTGN